MKISCQNCSSKYTVSDEKVQGKTVKLKCKKCGATILVNAGGATTVAGGAGVADHASSPPDASTDGTSYMVNVGEGDQRTMSLGEIVAAYQSQVVTADTYVWADGMTDWLPLGQVEAIVSALSGTSAASAHVPSSPPPAVAPMAAASSAETAASAASLAASSRAAATRQGGGKRADVFGNEKSDDVATSAPLFSASARAAASNAAAAARPSQQREENSVLFSLSALTSKAATATPAPAPSRKDSREDSGLIDLRALAAAAAPAAPSPSVPAPAMMGHDDGGLFPLGVGASQPAAPPVATPVVQAPPASKAPMFIGVGALVAAIAIVGVFFAMKGEDKPPVTDAATTATSVLATQPTATQTATQTAAVEPTATATATATASATAVASAPKGGTSKGGTSTSKGGTSTAGTSGGATTKPTSTGGSKPPSKCNCAPTDLMCNMKCSAGGK